MWRVLHQYMDTMNGPADFLEEPVSPITGTRFENARSTKMVHICEFTADLIHNGKIELDPSRNDRWNVTFHDSCNPARAMGLLEEPRYILRSVCNQFHEMPENTIREQTFCCGSGSGLGTDENFEMRMRGGLPRANAVKYVRDKHGVNLLACICAIDKATLPTLLDYWVPGVDVAGIHELVGNALVMTGEKERTTDLRGEPIELKWRRPMRDRGIIWSALALFLALLTLPVWHNLSASVTGTGPKLRLPAQREAVRGSRGIHADVAHETADRLARDGSANGRARLRFRRNALQHEPHSHLPGAMPWR